MRLCGTDPFTEFNAVEPLWHHTRVQGTHNCCFKNRQEILGSLHHVFQDMQRHPEQILGYLRPFQRTYVPLFMSGQILMDDPFIELNFFTRSPPRLFLASAAAAKKCPRLFQCGPLPAGPISRK